MSTDDPKAVVLGFPEYRAQAQRLATAADLEYRDVDVRRFPDGESLVRLPDELPAHVVFCRTLSDANSKLIELMLATATARRLGAQHITLVAPYLCYMRQDAAFHPGEAISQRIVGELLAREVDALITLDPHLHRTQRLEDAVPVQHAMAVTAAPLMAAWLAGRFQAPVIVGPDEESAQWVSRIAEPGGYDFCVASKTRLGDRKVIVALPDRAFEGLDIVLVDDVVSTGHTLAETARQLAARGTRSLTVLVSHALFADGALQRLQSAGITAIISTDSIPHLSNQLNLAPLLADTLAGLAASGAISTG